MLLAMSVDLSVYLYLCINAGQLLSGRQTNDKVGQLLGRGLVSKDNRPMECTTSKLLTCRVTDGGPIRSAFYVVSQSKNKAT